jgi:hypothetical protein
MISKGFKFFYQSKMIGIYFITVRIPTELTPFFWHVYLLIAIQMRLFQWCFFSATKKSLLTMFHAFAFQMEQIEFNRKSDEANDMLNNSKLFVIDCFRNMKKHSSRDFFSFFSFDFGWIIVTSLTSSLPPNRKAKKS